MGQASALGTLKLCMAFSIKRSKFVPLQGRASGMWGKLWNSAGSNCSNMPFNSCMSGMLVSLTASSATCARGRSFSCPPRNLSHSSDRSSSPFGIFRPVGCSAPRLAPAPRNRMADCVLTESTRLGGISTMTCLVSDRAPVAYSEKDRLGSQTRGGLVGWPGEHSGAAVRSA